MYNVFFIAINEMFPKLSMLGQHCGVAHVCVGTTELFPPIYNQANGVRSKQVCQKKNDLTLYGPDPGSVSDHMNLYV